MNEHQFPFINHQDETELLDWLVKDIESKFRSRSSRNETIRRLDAMFKGLPYDVNNRGNNINDLDEQIGLRRPKSIYNFINEMVEAKVSQRSRFKPAIAVIPNNINTDDENRAETVKTLLTSKAQEINLDKLISDGDKINFLSGESYSYVRWNKNIGGIDPLYKQALDQGVELKYEDGTPMPVVYKGDIDIEILGPDRCYHQLGPRRWEDVNDLNICGWVHVDELKADYPEKAGDIQASEGYYSQYFDSYNRNDYEYNALVVEYYCRPTRFMPNGAYVKFTPGCLLEVKLDGYPYKHNQLPVVFDTDIDSQGEITGRPFTANIEKLQRLHDMTSASMARGFAIANSPKWLYAKGSIDANKLTNQYSSLEFKGPVAPQLASFNGVPSASLDILAWSEKGIEKASSVYGISRGEPPKGIKAAVALQFLDEQEMQRESRGMAKRQRRIINIYEMSLALMQQFYTPEDGRIFKYLGEDNSYLVSDFSTMDISGEYDIKIENSSSLPDSKTGKIAAILDLNTATQADPMFNKEAIAQMLDLGNDRRFKIQNTSALKAAQFKLQKILNGEPSPEPRSFDDFLVEYPVFMQAIRQREFKGEEPSVMEALINYITGMEFEMWKKAQMNPMFMQKAMMFSDYPAFYKIPLMAPAMAAAGPQASGTDTVGKMESNNAEMADQQAMKNEVPMGGN
jgi:hypothetical protein